MKKAICIIVPVIFCFLVGYISQLFQAESISTWYPLLNKPPLTPPNIAFPIAWSILYLCMGISIGLIIASDNEYKQFFIWLFGLQLLLNFTWSIYFFYMQSPLLGFINIILLDLAIIYYIVRTYKTAKVSSILFFPYILWVGFATYLNLYILLHN